VAAGARLAHAFIRSAAPSFPWTWNLLRGTSAATRASAAISVLLLPALPVALGLAVLVASRGDVRIRGGGGCVAAWREGDRLAFLPAIIAAGAATQLVLSHVVARLATCLAPEAPGSGSLNETARHVSYAIAFIMVLCNSAVFGWAGYGLETCLYRACFTSSSRGSAP
jgi:hypothetical protein